MGEKKRGRQGAGLPRKVERESVGHVLLRFCVVVLAFLLLGWLGRPILAVTPQSPEVRQLINAGLTYLEKPITDGNGVKLGGRCLVGLAFLKAERRDHPQVAEAVKACRETMSREVNLSEFDVYSNGLAIV